MFEGVRIIKNFAFNRVRVCQSVLFVLLGAMVLSGCLQNGNPNPNVSLTSVSTTSTSTTTSTTTATATAQSVCAVFQTNTSDYNQCLSCSTSNQNTTDITVLAQCVHQANSSIGAGKCTGLQCGDGQTADFTNCTCISSGNPSFMGATPGQDDTSSPFMDPGFTIVNRYCPAAASPDNTTTFSFDCLLSGGGGGATKTNPLFTTSPPANVFQDVGYVRWDLALDASQYSPQLPLQNGHVFPYSSSTLAGTESLYFQLKPSTVITAQNNTITWRDCVEHFSGFTANGNSSLSTNAFCEPPSFSGSVVPEWGILGLSLPSNAASGTVNVSQPTTNSGTSNLISLNGDASNTNLTGIDLASNPPLINTIGMAKNDNGAQPGAGYPADTSFFNTQDNQTIANTALFSNIGYYKYSWGPLTVSSKTITDPLTKLPTTFTNQVSGRISVNANLGFAPAGAVDSTAFSPEANNNGSVQGNTSCQPSTNKNAVAGCVRDCTQHNPSCAVTAVYRTTGGGVLYQSFSPSFGSSHTSPVGTLPTGITAVSTPKIVEDTSQILTAGTGLTQPARLRVFVRAADGNIYMSRGQQGQWNAWISLGRPWTCNPASGNCIGYSSSIAVYKPFIGGTGLPNPYDSTNPNGGLSIIGEPVVVRFKQDATHPELIAVFVRVSQMTQMAAGSGINQYHNAVFYTYAMSGNPPNNPVAPASGQLLDFDNVVNWSPWLPVVDTHNSILHIQGNPLVVLDTSVAVGGINPISAYLFATSGGNGDGIFLHPPVAPKASLNNAAFDKFIYYNYDSFVNFTSINLQGSQGSQLTPNTLIINNTKWNPIGIEGIGFPIVSDWSYSLAKNGGAVIWRLYANVLTNGIAPGYNGCCDVGDINEINKLGGVAAGANCINMTNVPGGCVGGLLNLQVPSAGCKLGPIVGGLQRGNPFLCYVNKPSPVSMGWYSRRLAYAEFYPSASVSSGVAQNPATNPATNTALLAGPLFNGNISTVNPMVTSESSVADPNCVPSVGNCVDENRTFLFGRSVCPDQTKCDPYNPTAAYAIVSQDSINGQIEAGNGGIDGNANFAQKVATMYWGGMAVWGNPNNGGTPSQDQGFITTNLAISPTYATSDVLGFASAALEDNQSSAGKTPSSRVPFYLILRDQNGRIAHGYWTGNYFSFFSAGGFTN